MQQIEEIRRMSELAKQLRERGLATDSLDALNQARNATSSDPAVAQARKEDMLQERIALLERKMEQSQRRIEELQAGLEFANKRAADAVGLITAVSGKLRDLESQHAAQELARIPTPQWQAPAGAPQATVPSPASASASDEISIEKFFYCGKK